MYLELADQLVCPRCAGTLRVEARQADGLEVHEGALHCDACDEAFPIVRGVPRFVPPENYAETFGQQWKRFPREQLDSATGLTLSHDRFYDVTRWDPADLLGQRILDVGCGTGRFAEIALAAGATVVAVDISSSVEVAYEHLSQRFPGRVLVVQASIYELPLRKASFDRTYCIGVIQHTPDPPASVRAVAEMPKLGGQLAMWIYENRWDRHYLGVYAWKYGLRHVTKRLGVETNYRLSWLLTALCWPMAFPLLHMGKFGKLLLFWMPIAACAYVGKGYDAATLFRCVVMDTLDMYSPAHDHPQRFGPVTDILAEVGYEHIARTCTGLGLSAQRR